MDTPIVRDLMMPLDECPSVGRNATLADIINLLVERSSGGLSGPAAHYVVVRDDENDPIGRMDAVDLLQGLDPKYKTVGDFEKMSRFGFSPNFFEYIMRDMDLFSKPMDDLCRKAGSFKVVDLMTPLLEDNAIDADASLNVAIHNFIVRRTDLILVMEKHKPIGLISLGRVVEEVSQSIMRCAV